MKVVVTGGSGLIGEYVVDELKKFHHEVTNFDIKNPKDKSVDFTKADMLKIDDCRKAFKGAEDGLIISKWERRKFLLLIS